MEYSQIFDHANDLTQFEQNQKIAVAAIFDALDASMEITITRLLTPNEADIIAGYSATAKVDAVIAKNAAAAGQTVAVYTNTINRTKSINDTKVPILNALSLFTEGSVVDDEETRSAAISMIALCVLKYQETQTALTTLATKEHVANERQELYLMNMQYIMALYDELQLIANDTSHKYETYDALTGTTTPLITRSGNAATYPDVYSMTDANHVYRMLLGDYRQNTQGQFLNARNDKIEFDEALKTLTDELVPVDHTSNRYYDRNGSAITVYEDNTITGFINRSIYPFDVFDTLVLEQGGSQGLLHDILRTQEQEDIYNLIKAYQSLLDSKYHIRWYRKNPDYNGAPDKYVGYGWEMLNDLSRTLGETTITTETTPQRYTDYSLKDPSSWYRVFYAGDPSNFNSTYTQVKISVRDDGTPIWRTIFGTPPQKVLDSADEYFYFATTGNYNWDDPCRWILEDYPTISLNAVIDHTQREFYILPQGSNTAIVTCRNRQNAYVYVAGDTQFYPDPDNVKTKLLSEDYQKIVTSYQWLPTEVTHFATYVERPRPYELFSLNNVELWSKRETTTFKAVITYNGTFIQSNEIVFKNRSNAALADLINEFNSRFKLQLVRPIHNAVHEVADNPVFGTKHIADDNVSEFFVFDERGHALENEEGIPYYQVPYYAILLMKDPEKEDATYEVLQYNNAAGNAMDELTLLVSKLVAWGRATEWGTNDNIKDTTAAGYLSTTDRIKMAAYCNVETFAEVYTNEDGTKNERKLQQACQSLSDDNPTSAYAISWVTTDQNQTSRELGNRSMFNYCKRLSTEQLNDRLEIGLDTRQRVFALEFKIKPDWSLANNNPTEVISLDINYNGQVFRVERELHFGPGSTMGSEYSISVVASHATDKSTNSHVLLIDSAHSSGGGICNYYLNAVIRHKGKELTDEERNKMSVYWYLNSGLNDDEYTSSSVNQMSINEAGTLSIRYKPEVGPEVPHPIVPPIVILRVDGLAPYSLYYAQPFQVFCRTGMALNAANPWRVSVPDRVLFRSDGAEPQFHDASFTITKVEYAADTPNAISLDPLEWKQIDYTPSTHSWTIRITANDTQSVIYRAAGNDAFSILGARYMDPQYIYYQKIEGTVPVTEGEEAYWRSSVNQNFIIHIAAEVTGGYVEVAQLNYVYVQGNELTPTIAEWTCAGILTPEECLDNIVGDYTPTYKLNQNNQAVPPWKLYSRYHVTGSLFTDNTTLFSGERISDVGHEFFMNINDGSPYGAKLDMSHYLCIKHNGALIGEEPIDGSNAYGIPSGEVWSLGFVDGANTQWEERLRDAHTYLECELPDGAWFTSSIVFERSVYCSSLVNSWSGSELILDEETNTVMTQHLVVGSKDSNNTFTGLMMGDWNGRYNDGSIDVPGLYGFRSGAQTFGLLTTGEAFFGAAGSGRIYINKAAGVISNYNMTAYINLNPRKTDKIDEYTYDIRSKGYSPFFLYCEGDYDSNAIDGITGPNTNWRDLETKAKTRDVFAVDPHRGLFMSGGIHCNWGNIGGWEISDAGLTKKKNNSKIYLGIGNDTAATAENLYLYMLLYHYLNDQRGITGCHDQNILSYYESRLDSTRIRTGMTYIDLLKEADQLWWDNEWKNGQGFARDTVQRIFLAYQSQVYNARPNHTSPNAISYQADSEAAFRNDIAAGWLLPFRYLNWLYKIEPITQTDGYISIVNYPLLVENGTYSVFNYINEIKELYEKSRQSIETDLGETPYLVWAGPAATTMDNVSPGIFSVTGDGYLYAESGTVGGWSLSKRKFYSANNVTTYVYDENGQKLKGEYGDYITTQNGDGNYLIELDTGNKATEGYNSPYIALLNRSILLESAASGAHGRTYARMGFYYDPEIAYSGRMKKRADSSELYYDQVIATIEVDVPDYDQNGTQTGTHKETRYDSDEFGNYKYNYVLKKYKLPSAESTSWGVEASYASPVSCGWVVTADNDPDGHYLTPIHYWEQSNGNTSVEYIRYQSIDVDGTNGKGVFRYTTGGYNIVIDGNDSANRGSIKLGQCVLNDGTLYPAVEILGTGVIRLHYDNIILDGVNREVQIGTKDDNGTVSIVGFSIRSTDVDTINIDYRGGPTDGDNLSIPDTEFSTANPDASATETDTSYWDVPDPENYTVGYGLTLTYDVPYQAHNYKLNIDGDYLEFSRYLANETGNDRFTDKGLVMVAGTVTKDNLGDGATMRELESPYDKTILLPASNLSVNPQTQKAIIGLTARTGLLYRWDLVGDWVSTGTVYASHGVFGPDGELASVQYVNEKLADLASQIASILGKLNGNVSNLRRIIKAMAGGDNGIKQILAEDGQAITYTYTDDQNQTQTVQLSATNLLDQVVLLLQDLNKLKSEAATKTAVDSAFETLTTSINSHVHKINPPETTSTSAGSKSVSIDGTSYATADSHTHNVDVAEFDSGAVATAITAPKTSSAT